MAGNGAIHEVAIEFLRDGEPENRLFSQSTPYWALCGNFEPAALRLPFDQLEFELRLDDLSYTQPERGPVALDDIARKMRAFLSGVSGLGTQVAGSGFTPGDLIQLRLVLTPRELSLLPFEASQTPTTLPGGATALVLQPAYPMTITREVRGVARRPGEWPREPKILFAWAAPTEVSSVPWQDHARALRRAIDPWVRFRLGKDAKQGLPAGEAERKRHVRALLTILPEASVKSIAEACAAEAFTHVHILAHGVPRKRLRDIKDNGIALHGNDRKMEAVGAARLAKAITMRPLGGGSGPAVVTLATCESAQIRSVVAVGGSLAHELHMSGVPFVVASQFPLSKSGSSVLVEQMYQRLLDGVDPRLALYESRVHLYLGSTQYHDWASVVAYAALPPDIERQVKGFKLAACKRDIDNLFDELAALTDPEQSGPLLQRKFDLSQVDEIDVWQAECERVFASLREPVEALPRLIGDHAEAVGLQASAAKREAEMLHRMVAWVKNRQPGKPDRFAQLEAEAARRAGASLDRLAQAANLYDQALQANLRHWVGVQLLSLQLVTLCAQRAYEPLSFDMWSAMRLAAQRSLDQAAREGNAAEVVWSYGSLAELHLIAALWIAEEQRLIQLAPAPIAQPQQSPVPDWGVVSEHLNLMRNALDQVNQRAARHSFEWFSTWRQFNRYATWWHAYFGPLAGDIARQAAARLR